MPSIFSAMGRFGSCPRHGHLVLHLHIYGYLNQFPCKRITIDSSPLDITDSGDIEKLKCDFLKEYKGAKEDSDPKFPVSRGAELMITFLVDSDHAHDKVTRKSITGLIGYVGSTPVIWYSKGQGAVASSTYAAELIALRQGTEEIINMHYMLRCLGVPVNSPCNLLGDNLWVKCI